MNEFEAPKRSDEFALEIDQLSLEGVLVWADVPSNDLFVWRQRQQQQQRTSLIDLDEVIEKRQVKSENFLRLPSKLHSTFVEKKKTKRRSRNCSFPETMTPQMKNHFSDFRQITFDLEDVISNDRFERNNKSKNLEKKSSSLLQLERNSFEKCKWEDFSDFNLN